MVVDNHRKHWTHSNSEMMTLNHQHLRIVQRTKYCSVASFAELELAKGAGVLIIHRLVTTYVVPRTPPALVLSVIEETRGSRRRMFLTELLAIYEVCGSVATSPSGDKKRHRKIKSIITWPVLR